MSDRGDWKWIIYELDLGVTGFFLSQFHLKIPRLRVNHLEKVCQDINLREVH